MRRSVQDCIWGYHDSVFQGVFRIEVEISLVSFIDISPLMKLAAEYNSFDGKVTVNTGKDDIKIVATWEKWNGKYNVDRYYYATEVLDERADKENGESYQFKCSPGPLWTHLHKLVLVHSWTMQNRKQYNDYRTYKTPLSSLFSQVKQLMAFCKEKQEL
jgi:hypothetical protein